MLNHLLARMRASSKRPLFSVDVSICPDVWMSVRVFKMLLLQEFLSDLGDFLARWSPTLGKLMILMDSGSGRCDVINDVIKFSV